MKSRTIKGNAAAMDLDVKNDVEPPPSTATVDTVTEDTRRSLDRWLASLSAVELTRLSKCPSGDPDMLRYLQEEIARRERAPPWAAVLTPVSLPVRATPPASYGTSSRDGQ
jgi:hypothetical protein